MQPVSKKTLSIYWKHAKRYKWRFLFIFVGCLITAMLDIYRPFLYRDFVNQLSSDYQTTLQGGQVNPDLAYNILWAILYVAGAHVVIWRLVELVNNYFQPKSITNLMNTCYDYLLGHSYNFFNNTFVGSITSRVRKFAHAFETVADQVCFELGRTILIFGMLVISLLIYYPKYGWIALGWMIFYFLFAYIHARYKLKYDIALAEHDTKVTGSLSDTMTNSVNIKLFTSHEKESDNFKGITDRLFKLRRLSWNLGALANAVQGITMVTLEVFVMYLAIKDCQTGNLTIGGLAFLQAYIFKMIEKSWQVGRQIRSAYTALADANEMTTMLEQPHEVVDHAEATELKVGRGEIVLRDVVFSYIDGQTVIDKLNLNIRGGERVALVGESGGGKSTVVKLLLRFIDLNDGSIEIDGQNIAKVTQHSLRSQIGFVPQDPILFHRSLMENIRYGRPQASDQEVIAAAQAAHCDNFIANFQDGYDTLVGERGVKLSGGERQRVAIARAFLKNAPILVLDEATSSLDAESEILIQDSLRSLLKGRTTVVIAHRLSTIKEMDRIIMIQQGKVIEQGTHAQLVAKGGRYAEHWKIQSGGFVLNATV